VALRHAARRGGDRVRAVEAAFLKTLKHPEFVAEAEKTRISQDHLAQHEGLSMLAALKEKLKTVLTPKG
jgi:hypothetical protein